MSRGDVPPSARIVAVIALILLAAGSITVGSLWLAPATYGQADAAGYGAGLFWPVTIICTCVLGSFALAKAKRQKRMLLVLNVSGVVLIVGAYAIAFGTNIINSTPLRGVAEGVLIVVLLAINGSAIFCTWRYLLRHEA